MISVEMCADRGLYKLNNEVADLGIYSDKEQGFYILKIREGELVLDVLNHSEASPRKYLRMTPCMPDKNAFQSKLLFFY